MEAGVVIRAARREKVDVTAALRTVEALEGEELAVELVRLALDADERTVDDLLAVVARVKPAMLRARTLFSLLGRAPSRLVRNLPPTAQERIASLVEGLEDEAARAAALRNTPQRLPADLERRLRDLSASIADPLLRHGALLRYEIDPTPERQAVLLATALEIEEEAERGEALGDIASRLQGDRLEEAYRAARSLRDPGVAGRALSRIAPCLPPEQRAAAQLEILELSASIADPLRRFDVRAALRDLPPDGRVKVGALLHESAMELANPAIRCRALFLTAEYVADEELRNRALLGGIAAAECVADEQQRSELFHLLRPNLPWLEPGVRRELTRAVERISDSEIRQELYETLGRFFVYERPREETAAAVQRYDLFISYSTADERLARSLSAELKSRGVRVFLASEAIDAAVGSTSWNEAIDDALVASRAMLVLLTQPALDSKWVREEWGKYYQHLVETGAGRLLSIRLGGPPRETLPLTLRRFQIIESASGEIEPSHLTRILDIVRGV